METRTILGSWKEIAGYLGRSVKTCQRWERELGLPVRRLDGTPKAHVFASRDELDTWIAKKLSLDGASDRAAAPPWRRDAFGAVASLAVLPMQNLSGDHDQEYFADGITEALITELGQIAAIRVISHQSVRHFKHSEQPLPEIARLLNVDAVVEGTILETGPRVRLTANLVRAVPEGHLWADNYGCEAKDIESVQRQIASEIARVAGVSLPSRQLARLSKPGSVDPEAYDLYLKAKTSITRSFVQAEIDRALQYCERALAIAPDFAPALAELAWCHGQLGCYAFSSPRRAFSRQKAAAEQALAIDPGLAEAYGSLGLAAFGLEWNWLRADQLFNRALELNPSSVRIRRSHLYYLGCVGRIDESVVWVARLLEIDPLDPENRWMGAWIHFWCRRYDEAIAAFGRLVAMSPDDHWLHMALALSYACLGSRAETLAEANLARSGIRLGMDQQFDTFIAYADAQAGRRERAQETLGCWLAIAKRRDVNPVLMATLYAVLGNSDDAFKWLEVGYRQRCYLILWSGITPLFDSLRGDPRYKKLLRRLNLPRS
jgi:TolB-like protein/tetratricopeptide (TPR) repeat protein